jgi:hypothetical protein
MMVYTPYYENSMLGVTNLERFPLWGTMLEPR